MLKMPKRILIVGAGMTGSLTAALLHRNLLRQVEIVVWEKSRGFGGRMNTNRNPENSSCTADLGAQYISATPHYSKDHERFYKELLDAQVLKPFEGVIEDEMIEEEGTQHYITPCGVNSIVKHFFKSADAKIEFGTHCSAVNQVNNNWTVTTQENQLSTFDAVIVTIPVPQLLNLEGDIQNHLSPYKDKLQSVKYSSRYALALYFNPGDGLDVPWSVKYVNGDPCVRFISIDNKKRGVAETDAVGQSVVIHTSVPFGLQHLEMDLKDIEQIILCHMKNLFPDLASPSHSRCIRWRFSQVSQPYPGSPGAIVLSRNPPLVVGGDAFFHSNFDGCVTSATKITEHMLKLFSQGNE